MPTVAPNGTAAFRDNNSQYCVSSIGSVATPSFQTVTECPALSLVTNWIAGSTATHLYKRLRTEQPWPENTYTIGNRRFALPRLQTWHGDPGIVYSYSNNLLQTRPWTPLLWSLKNAVEQLLSAPFNAVLVNYYRNGEDYLGWHSDDEIEVGPHPLIASLSLGADRKLSFRRKGDENFQGAITLENGSLLIMHPEFQHQWQHSVLPNNEREGRINLTFRKILSNNERNF